MSIHYTLGENNLVLDVEPVAVIPEYISLVQDGKTVGSVDAKVDFSTLPDEHHSLVLSLLSNVQTRITLPSSSKATIQGSPRPTANSWWRFW